ncbi:hypothetical protein [Thiothrix unzii]|jgi:predicted transcriptional regulator|uniref:hypothetical protein n=1 Tax=Thiothrix unzii TaxID=111769 RepID=UPI002A36DFF0|nr:hypothetical protein [Thiothrix unzii]MDX9987514.1 hypothetical protein [Thiothrix unzii]
MGLARKIAVPKAVRKNFTMSDDTVKELDFLAGLLRKKQSQIIQELIHRESEAHRNELRLAKLEQMKGAFTGLIGDGQSIQRMKSERIL